MCRARESTSARQAEGFRPLQVQSARNDTLR
jgi:hypothetical protein